MRSQRTALHRLLLLGCQQLSAGGVHAVYAIIRATAAAQQLPSISGRGSIHTSRINSSSEAAQTTADSDPSSSSSSSSKVPSAHAALRQRCRVAGRQWIFETGRLAKLAHGSCLVTVGGTSVLATAVVDPTPQLEADGVPLQVEFRERLSAAGRLPVRPDRRERAGTEREVLAARIVDRALRPLINPGFLYDTQVWCQVLSADGLIEPEVVAINAASAAILLAPEIPFTYPIGAVRAINRRGRIVLNPSVSSENHHKVQLRLTYAGSPVKATAMEAAAMQVSEGEFLQTMRLAAKATEPLIDTQLQLAAAAAAGHSAQQYNLGLIWPSDQLQQEVEKLIRQPLRDVFSQQQQQQQQLEIGSSKSDRAKQLAALQRQLLADLQRLGLLADEQSAGAAAGLHSKADALRAFDVLQSRVMREVVLADGRRVDGRELSEIRPISCEAGCLPRCVHGSGLFTRGETQSLATATVGHDRDVPQVEGLFISQVATIDSSSSSSNAPLHLHYSFPPFSVGELGKAGPPNRREVGHGNLARSALLGIMPSAPDFPFTVRVTADTLGSSGSSSMAAVCAGSLALSVAGVPVHSLAAGISVGLVTEQPPQLGQISGQSDQQQQQQYFEAASSGNSSGDETRDYSSIVSRGVSRKEVVAAAATDEAAADDQQQEAATVADATAADVQQADAAPVNAEEGSASSSDTIAEASGMDLPAAEESTSTSSGSSDNSGSSDSSTMLQSSYGPALLLTDIQGIEDHLGDMDFKVAGTSEGITALQLDTKLPGVDLHLLEAALPAAAAARQKLLASMSDAIDEYKRFLPDVDTPEFDSVQIMKDLVPRLIGPQGSTLLQIEETCGARLIVNDTGSIIIYAPTQQQYQHAVAAVQEVEGRGAQAGEVYHVRVLRVVDFGAYVSLPNGLPAMLHVSEISHDKIRDVNDVLHEGDEFDVVCKGRDAKGFVRISRKDLLPHPETGVVAAEQLIKKLAASEHGKQKKREQLPRMDVWQPSG